MVWSRRRAHSGGRSYMGRRVLYRYDGLLLQAAHQQPQAQAQAGGEAFLLTGSSRRRSGGMRPVTNDIQKGCTIMSCRIFGMAVVSQL